tara:strand:+ start:513 stop:659 length:147 start_codon:yes stop_codon:yes gene_type:complete
VNCRGELSEVIYEGARALGARGNVENGGEEERRRGERKEDRWWKRHGE